MGYTLKQGDLTKAIEFILFQSSDHTTPATGKTPSVALSKNGAAFAPAAGAVVEVGNGVYKVTPNAGDLGTLGPLAVYVTATGCDPVVDMFQVVAYDPYDVARIGLTNLDATVSSRLPTSGYTAPDNTTIAAIAGYVDTEIAAIKAKTDGLPSDPADASVIAARFDDVDAAIAGISVGAGGVVVPVLGPIVARRIETSLSRSRRGDDPEGLALTVGAAIDVILQAQERTGSAIPITGATITASFQTTDGVEISQPAVTVRDGALGLMDLPLTSTESAAAGRYRLVIQLDAGANIELEPILVEVRR